MSRENVERLQRAFEGWDPKAELEAWKRGEARDGPLSLLDPEVAYEDTYLPDHAGETYRGYEGIARATERWLEPFESVRVELERIVGEGDRLLSIQRFQGKARHTGIKIDATYAYVFTFRDGKVVHLKSYADPAEALKASGLSG